MEAEVLEIVEVELKYCERCGALWLRPKGTQEVYCEGCLPKMGEMAVWRRRNRPRLPVGIKIEGRRGELIPVVGEGGEA